MEGIGSRPPAARGQRLFAFRPGAHEPGAKIVLGRRYAESGEAEGEAATRDLCAHPATALFIATKLVRHFVADDPPVAAVDRVAATFRESGGDMAEVSCALIHLDEAWDPAYEKLRTPEDWVVAVLRALEVQDGCAPALSRNAQPAWRRVIAIYRGLLKQPDKQEAP